MLVLPWVIQKSADDLKSKYEKKRENILQSDMDDKKKAAELEKLKKQYDRAVIGQMMRA